MGAPDPTRGSVLCRSLASASRIATTRRGPTSWAGARELLLTRTSEYADPVWQITHRRPILDEPPTITVPLTVVADTEDHTYPPPTSEQIVAPVPHARYVVMERTGHVHALENPEAVNAVLEEHLAALG